MVQIGRRLYYLLATGEVVLNTGERVGDVIETTVDQDFDIHPALQMYAKDAVGVKELDFGQYADMFERGCSLRIDPQTGVLLWGAPAEVNVSLDTYKQSKNKLLDELCDATVYAGFVSPTTGHSYRLNTEDQLNFLGTNLELMGDPNIMAIPWNTTDSGPVQHTREEFLSVVAEGMQFKRETHAKLWSLKEQVSAATTRDEVNNIQW